MYRVRPLFVGGLVTLCLPVFAADELISFQSFNGYTGLINTPTAEVLATGTVDIGHNNQLDFKGNKYVDGHNFIFSAGLFDGLEASGQIAASSMNDNLYYSQGRGQLRDLSFNIKYQIPFIPHDWLSLAIGAKDIGGAANNYETYYAVASKEVGDFRFSAGVATSDRVTGQMDGVFAGVEWQLFDWFSLQAEHDGEAENAAARITVPKQWLYDLGTLTFTSRFYSNSDFDEESTYWGVNFSMPLSRQGSANATQIEPAPYSHSEVDTSSNASHEQLITQVTPKTHTKNGYLVNKSQLKPALQTRGFASNNSSVTNDDNVIKNMNTEVAALKVALANDGFENILVGYNRLHQIVVKFENPVFNRNDIDAIGLVLGRIVDHISQPDAQFNVLLAKYDISLMAVTGQVANYRAFIEDNITPDLNVSSGTLTSMPKELTWVGLTRANSPYFKPRVTIGPALTNAYATEVGVYDFSLAIRADVDVPLWQGGGVSIGGQVNVANSDDFDKNAPFRRYREESGLDRATLYQTFALPFGLYNQTQLGYFKEDYDYTGIINETAWLSSNGRHKITANVGYFDYQDYDGSRDYKTLEYQYSWVEKNITLHATAGDFWHEDTGARIEGRFWFGDGYIGLFYENTEAQKAGVSFSIPLTPRKDMDVTKYGQIKGNEAWRHVASTQVGESHNNLVFNQAYTPNTAVNLNRTFLNQGRMSSDYIYANLVRLKNAYVEYK